MQLADPATVQAFETTVVNSNMLALEYAIVVDRAKSPLGGVQPFSTVAAMKATSPADGTLAVVRTSGISAYNGTYYYSAAGAAWIPTGPKMRGLSGKTGAYPQDSMTISYFERVSATSGAGGVMPAVVFPTPFPNGILGVMCFPLSGTNAAMSLNNDTQSITGFTAFSGSPSTAIIYQYLAIGW
jgi:hypothetical protein